MHPSRWAATSERLLLWFSAATIFIAGFGPWLSQSWKVQRNHRLGGDELSITPETGHAWVANLHALQIDYQADVPDAPSRSTLELFEDGKPLRPHAMHEDIRRSELGCFSHWGGGIYFSTTDGSDPLTNGRVYEVRYTEIALPWLGTTLRACLPAAVLALLAFAGMTLLRPEAVSRKQRSMLAVALIGCFVFQLWEGRHNYGVSPDSISYMETPKRSARMPIYYGLMALVTDPAQAEARARELNGSGKSNTLLKGGMDAPLVRIVFAQKALLLAALVGLYFALSLVVPPALAAALVLVIGFSNSKLIVPNVFLGMIAGLWAVVALVTIFLQRKRGQGASARGFFVAGLLAFVLPVGWSVALRFPLLPGYFEFIMSEPMTMAFQALFVGALVLHLHTDRCRWLAVAMIFASLAYLVRPAAIFCPAAVAVVAFVSLARRRRQWRKLVFVLGLGAFMGVMPGLYKRIVDAPGRHVSMRHWAMAAFALSVAEPDDAVLMPDWTTRFVFESAMREREKARAKIPDNPGALYLPDIDRLGFYTYQIVLPVSQRMAEERYPQDEIARVREWNRILGEMAQPIFKAHWDRLLRIYVSSYRFMVWQGTRFSQMRPFWVTLLAAGVLAALCRNRTTISGVVLCATHLLHLLVVSIFDQPLDRYVYATEFMVFLGLSLISWGALLSLKRTVPFTATTVPQG